MPDLDLDDLKSEYSLRRHIIIVVIVAVFFIVLFALWPLIWDLIIGDTSYSTEPSERLNDSIRITFFLRYKKE